MKPDNNLFSEKYAALNPAQREAVDAIEGPVMVVAGPGTGKTQILTLRIANILKKADVNPENILALTFTEAGAAAMRRRLGEIVGAPAYRVAISTFHGFCNGIIRDYPESFPRIIGSQSITEVDQVAIVEQIVRDGAFTVIKPFGDPLYYVRDLVQAVNEIKREGADPEAFLALVLEDERTLNALPDLYHEKGKYKGEMRGEYKKELKQIEKNKELAEVYRHYEERLRAGRFYDYGDMIMEVLRELKSNRDLLLILQEQYHYVLVDEHQDTNKAQNLILELLMNFHSDPNLFVVGDEKQAIFRFQGASLENFLYFKKLYPRALLVILEDNYRSSQAILDSAHSMLPGKKELRSRTKHENRKVRIHAFSRADTEHYFVARDIREKIDSGVPPEEIAVLYRNNRDAAPFVPAFEKRNIPFVIESDENIMHDADIRKLIALFRALHEFGSDERLVEAMHIDFFNLHPLDIYRVMHAANAERISVYEVLRSDARMRALHLERGEALRLWYGTMSEWAVRAKNDGIQVFFEMIVRESGFLAHILARHDSVEKLEKTNGFFDEIQKLTEKRPDADVGALLEYLSVLETHKILIKKSAFGGRGGRVRLMTAHKSKGQEFSHVYIVNAFDGHWGNTREGNSFALPQSLFLRETVERGPHVAHDDERRLFYVALTRAKETITISYARESASGREQIPCQFIGEIREECIDRMDSPAVEREQKEDAAFLMVRPHHASADMHDKEFVRALFLERGLSVTALNNYLECPWKYFYQNLLRIPAAKTTHQMYGTAVHGALDDFFSAVQEASLPPKAFLLDRFVTRLEKEHMRAADYEAHRARGEKHLGGYYDAYHGKWHTRVITEFDVKGVLLTPEIKLTGKIDKMELEDGTGGVRVVDYKTGKQKTRGDIEGTTKQSNGNIKRQLVFYNVLLELYESGKRYHMVSGDIDFVEPDEKGRYKKESFTVTTEETAALRDLIKETAGEITELAFWSARCEDAECPFCGLRRMMGA